MLSIICALLLVSPAFAARFRQPVTHVPVNATLAEDKLKLGGPALDSETICGKYTTCSDCASNLCGWCEHDQICHDACRWSMSQSILVAFKCPESHAVSILNPCNTIFTIEEVNDVHIDRCGCVHAPGPGVGVEIFKSIVREA
jgi:hypothetical protein